jgi:hypothetical protein
MAIENGLKKERTGRRTTHAILLSALLAGSLLAVTELASATPAMAEEGFPHGNKKSAAIDPNFDIKKVNREGNGKLVMQVFGQAGGTVPAKPAPGQLGQVFVYAFFTDAGIWVINAHWECHPGPTGCDPSETHVSEWHAEKVTVANVAGYEKPCVTSISDERAATMDGHKAIVTVPEAKEVFAAQTAAFDLKTNPDAPTQACIAELNQVFDTASLAETSDD